MLRREGLVFGGALLALAGVATGNAWLTLLAVAAGWVVVAEGVRPPAPSAYRLAVMAGAVAAFIVTGADLVFVDVRFVFYVRRELAFLRVSPAVELGRGLLFATCLTTYVRLRMQRGVVLSTVGTVLMAVTLGFLFEHLGSSSGLWQWNAVQMPRWQVDEAWMFIPTAWGMTFVFAGYFLMSFHRRVPRLFYPIGVGIRCGAAYIGFLMIAYAMLLHVFGRVRTP